MILADTSVWIDHLRSGNEHLTHLLESGHVPMHPFVLGELALGNLRDRRRVLNLLEDLPRTAMATDDEVLVFIEAEALQGRGIGLIDAHLLAATRLTSGARLWTRDNRREQAEARLNLSAAAA